VWLNCHLPHGTVTFCNEVARTACGIEGLVTTLVSYLGPGRAVVPTSGASRVKELIEVRSRNAEAGELPQAAQSKKDCRASVS